MVDIFLDIFRANFVVLTFLLLDFFFLFLCLLEEDVVELEEEVVELSSEFDKEELEQSDFDSEEIDERLLLVFLFALCFLEFFLSENSFERDRDGTGAVLVKLPLLVERPLDLSSSSLDVCDEAEETLSTRIKEAASLFVLRGCDEAGIAEVSFSVRLRLAVGCLTLVYFLSLLLSL